MPRTGIAAGFKILCFLIIGSIAGNVMLLFKGKI